MECQINGWWVRVWYLDIWKELAFTAFITPVQVQLIWIWVLDIKNVCCFLFPHKIKDILLLVQTQRISLSPPPNVSIITWPLCQKQPVITVWKVQWSSTGPQIMACDQKVDSQNAFPPLFHLDGSRDGNVGRLVGPPLYYGADWHIKNYWIAIKFSTDTRSPQK